MSCGLEKRGVRGQGSGARSQSIVVSGQWSVASGQSIVASGQWPVVSDQKENNILIKEHRPLAVDKPVGNGSGGEGRNEGGKPTPRSRARAQKPRNALGLDFGSRYVKLVYGKENGGWGRKKLDSLTFFRDYLHRHEGRLAIDWQRLGLTPPEALVATGYGKNLLQEHFPTITEIRAHFLGARQTTGLDHFILLEVGGQDSKVLYVKEGRVFDFLANDRCAAGTGRYLENMARFLKMPLAEFAGAWQEPVDISHTCAIFGESELIGRLLEGEPPERIAAGVNASVARRALMMVRRYPCRTLVFVGGVARNQAVVRLLQDAGDYRLVVPSYPQFNGALGCCLEARNSLIKGGL